MAFSYVESRRIPHGPTRLWKCSADHIKILAKNFETPGTPMFRDILPIPEGFYLVIVGMDVRACTRAPRCPVGTPLLNAAVTWRNTLLAIPYNVQCPLGRNSD